MTTEENHIFYDIIDLVDQTYVPFESTILDEDIEEAIQMYDFVNKKLIYKGIQLFQTKPDPKNHVKKIATIAKEILNGSYDYNYTITLWRDGNFIDFDDLSMFHVRAFHFCAQNIPVVIKDV